MIENKYDELLNKLSFIEALLLLLLPIKAEEIDKVFINTKYYDEYKEIMKKD